MELIALASFAILVAAWVILPLRSPAGIEHPAVELEEAA